MVYLDFESCPLSSQFFTMERCFDFLGETCCSSNFCTRTRYRILRRRHTTWGFGDYYLVKKYVLTRSWFAFTVFNSASSSLQFYWITHPRIRGRRSWVLFLSFSCSFQQNLYHIIGDSSLVGLAPYPRTATVIGNHIMLFLFKQRVQNSLANPRVSARDMGPAAVQFLSFSCSFRGNIYQIIAFNTHIWSCRPQRKTLDPPLELNIWFGGSLE